MMRIAPRSSMIASAEQEDLQRRAARGCRAAPARRARRRCRSPPGSPSRAAPPDRPSSGSRRSRPARPCRRRRRPPAARRCAGATARLSSTSRLISSPTSRKNTAISPSLIQSSSGFSMLYWSMKTETWMPRERSSTKAGYPIKPSTACRHLRWRCRSWRTDRDWLPRGSCRSYRRSRPRPCPAGPGCRGSGSCPRCRRSRPDHRPDRRRRTAP